MRIKQSLCSLDLSAVPPSWLCTTMDFLHECVAHSWAISEEILHNFIGKMCLIWFMNASSLVWCIICYVLCLIYPDLRFFLCDLWIRHLERNSGLWTRYFNLVFNFLLAFSIRFNSKFSLANVFLAIRIRLNVSMSCHLWKIAWF